MRERQTEPVAEIDIPGHQLRRKLDMIDAQIPKR